MQAPPRIVTGKSDQPSSADFASPAVTSADEQNDMQQLRQHDSGHAAGSHESYHQQYDQHSLQNGHALQNGHTVSNRALLGTAPGDMFASRSQRPDFQRFSSSSAQNSPTRHDTSSQDLEGNSGYGDVSHGHHGARSKPPTSKQAASKTGLPALTAAGQRLEELQAMQKAKDAHKRQQRAMLASEQLASRKQLPAEASLGPDHDLQQHFSRKHVTDRHPHTCSRRNLHSTAEPSQRRLAEPVDDAEPVHGDQGMGVIYSNNDSPVSRDQLGSPRAMRAAQKEALFFTGLSELQAGNGPNPLLTSLDQIHDTGFSDFEEAARQHSAAVGRHNSSAVNDTAGNLSTERQVSLLSSHCKPCAGQHFSHDRKPTAGDILKWRFPQMASHHVQYALLVSYILAQLCHIRLHDCFLGGAW